MSIIQGHTSKSSTAIHRGFQINPLSPGLSKSPCREYPDTGEPCEFINEDKACYACSNCAVRGMGDFRLGDSIPTITNRWQLVGEQQKTQPECLFTGCEKVVSGIYCRHHYQLVDKRLLAWWGREGDKPVDIEWLHTPVIKREKKQRQEKRKINAITKK